MKLGKMLSVGEVVEHSAPEEPAVTVEQPTEVSSPVAETPDTQAAPAPVVVSADR